jgi:hypothetical protein
MPEIGFPTGWSGIAAVWGIKPEDALVAYLWSWAENQVMAALKAVPLGQAAGQRLLAELGGKIPSVAVDALKLPENLNGRTSRRPLRLLVQGMRRSIRGCFGLEMLMEKPNPPSPPCQGGAGHSLP